MKKLIFLLCFMVGLFNLLKAQNAIVGTGFSSGWGSGCTSPNGTDYTYLSASIGTTYTTGDLTPKGTGNQYWRLAIGWSGTFYQVSNGSDMAIVPGVKTNANVTCTATGSYYRNVSATTNRYVFKTLDAGTSPTGTWVFFELSGASATVSSVVQYPAASTVYVGNQVTVNATLSAAFPTGQGAYLRYSTDNFATSTVLSMIGSGTFYTATIPAQSLNTNIKYYVFTSGSALTISSTDADLYTINYNNNTGNNYSYTVSTNPYSLTSSVLIDFGATNDGTYNKNTTSPTNGNYWNNFTNNGKDGTSPSYFVDKTTGLATNFNAIVTTTFSVNNTVSLGLTGTSIGNDLQVDNATMDAFYAGTADTKNSIDFTGLNPVKRYRFYIFGCRPASDQRVTRYTLTGSTTTSGDLQTTNTNLGGSGINGNTTSLYISPFIYSNSSKISLDVVNAPYATGTKMGYLNSLKMEEYKGSQTITFNALAVKSINDVDFTPGATSATSATNPITYSSSNTDVATIVNNQIHIVGISGTSNITASQASSTDYDAAPNVIQTLTVSSTPAISSFSTANNNGTTTSGYVGTTVTVTGVNLNNISTLKVGGSGGTSISSFTKNSTTITFIATAGLSGAIYVSDGTDSYTTSSVYVDLGFVTSAATDWNTASTWLGAAVPVASSSVTIAHAITLNAAATNNISALTINASSSLTFGASGSINVSGTTSNSGSIIMTAGGILTVGAAGTLANGTSTFTAGAGTVIFTGAGTLSGTISLNNLTLNGALTNPTTVTVNGLLQLNSGATVSNAPTYGSSSTLIYNTGGTRAMGTEWTANVTTGSGVPQHVTIGNGSNSIIDFSASTNWYQLSGDLLINSGSTLKLAATNTTNGLKFAGNITNNGTLNTFGGAIWFVGSTSKTLSSSTDLTIDFLKLVSTADLKLSGSNFTINAAQLGLQFKNTGGLDLNGKTLTMNSGATISLFASSGIGVKTISSSSAGAIIAMAGSCIIDASSATGGSLTTTSDVTVTLLGALSIVSPNIFSTGGTVKVNNTTASVITNSLIYTGSGTLIYNTGGSYTATDKEWPTTNSPGNVTIQNS
ncbi:MAG: hypothetical protein WCG08_09845, partial [Paludibacter sp.]